MAGPRHDGLRLSESAQRPLCRPRWAIKIRDFYGRFTEQQDNFPTILRDSKRTILGTSLSSELYVLSNHLVRIAEQDRARAISRGRRLFRALRDVMVCFPVYRTYIRPGCDEVCDVDRRRIREAVRAAKRVNPATSPSFFDFVASVLLRDDPDGLSDAQREERRRFVLKFQQVSGPVTAKGMEDTAFYRYYPLGSLDEVGGDPAQAAVLPSNSTSGSATEWPTGRMKCWPPGRTTPSGAKICGPG